jgi:signal transduction histidine kinase
MKDNKLKKKIALIKTSCHAFGIHTGLGLEARENLELTLKKAEEAWDLFLKEQLVESRSLANESLESLREVTQTLSPASLRKALLRQLDKISKY